MSSVTAAKIIKSERNPRPRILVVDDEPSLVELVRDVAKARFDGRVTVARTIAEADKLLASQTVELLVADVRLPDGNGTSLLASLSRHQPHAAAIVITGDPTIDGVVSALRGGACDFLPKPFSADHLVDRLGNALQRQKLIAKRERRLDRLRDAVKRLNEARRTVSKKVDLLCNDLISAYGEISKQVDGIRTVESFRKTLEQSKDLEQMLCHAMDWVLRQLGYSNVAVWLASEENEFQLGAYMKFTTAGEPAFTEAMRNGLLPMINREGMLHLTADEARRRLTPAELKFMKDQTVLGINCTYLGESLAAMILFRDGKTPFSAEDAAAIKAISPIFATALATMVRGAEAEDGPDDDDHNNGGPGDDPFTDGPRPLDDTIDQTPPKPRRKNKRDEADWWKRGEAPPF